MQTVRPVHKAYFHNSELVSKYDGEKNQTAQFRQLWLLTDHSITWLSPIFIYE